jgi:hypothetical protein
LKSHHNPFIQLLIAIAVSTLAAQCESKNHIEKYQVDIETLKKMPNGFYAYRGGRVYQTDIKCEKYRIWFELDDEGNVGDIFRIQNFKHPGVEDSISIQEHHIDTLFCKQTEQQFIELSRKYKFGHLLVNKNSEICFSSIDGLPVEFAYPFSWTKEQEYQKRPYFKRLGNGWYENQKKD